MTSIVLFHSGATSIAQNCKRNVRLKIVASECDQCVWPVGVVAGYGHWVGIE